MQVIQKLTDEVYNKLYVTSDTHFNHNKDFIYKNRGYDTPQDMTAGMIEIINKVVGPDGILLHLGDFCLNTTYEEYYNILSKLRVKEIWMLWGNHNNPIQKTYGGTREQVCAWHQGIFIKYLNHYYTFRKGKKFFVCSHFPFRTWDGQSKGSMHMHGHCHGNLLSSSAQNKDQKILDVGWDVFSKPMHIEEIVKIMQTKEINSEHHA